MLHSFAEAHAYDVCEQVDAVASGVVFWASPVVFFDDDFLGKSVDFPVAVSKCLKVVSEWFEQGF